MKNSVHKLRVGDKFWAQIVENISALEFIVSIRGDLVRVRNESFNQLKNNEKILVRVMSLAPLALQIVRDEESSRAATHIDVSV